MLASSKTLSRLGDCEVCAKIEARYRCPKCEVKTCSVPCINIHKKELNCDGVRDRTKYIPLKMMTEKDFMSDYYFLEECTRYVQNRQKDSMKKYTRYNRDLPVHLFRLQKAAKNRQIDLKFLLQHFVRHKNNTTYFDWKEKKIWWCIKWIFLNAGSLCYTDQRCDETKCLKDLLEKYLNADCVEDVPEKRKLEYYHSKGLQNIKVLLKAEGIKRSSERFFLLNIDKTLTENLANKIIVEYPIIYLTYETDCEQFDIIDSDEDVMEETRTYWQKLQEEHKALIAQQDCDNLSNDNSKVDQEADDKLARRNRLRCERDRKRKEYERNTKNFLFTDENYMDVLSTDEDEVLEN